MRGALVAVLLVVTHGCVLDVGSEPLPPTGDLELFTALAQPVLAARCANPGCHGNEDRPLEIYAVQQHRLDEASLFRATPLTADELWRNAVRAAAFVGDLPGGASSLLDKPLAAAAGGASHEGGDVWSSITERDYAALAEWAATCDDGEAP